MNNMNWLVLSPQIVLLGMGCLILLVDLFVTHPRRLLTYWLTILTLAGVAWLYICQFQQGITAYAMDGLVVVDRMGELLGCAATLAVMVALIYGQNYAADRHILKGELFSLSIFSLLGICIITSGNNFLVLYLGLELMSLALYAEVGLRRESSVATEAAMKYFILGALASGFLLYGLSMLYGATGSLSLPEVFKVVQSGVPKPQVLAFATVFIVAGLAFKFSAVPFHMWAPDVYQGAPTVVTLLIAGAPKIAAFAMAMRLLVEGLLGVANDWQPMLIVLAVASLALGNLAALGQTNLKRMLAYSAIAQIGFVLLGLSCGVIGGNTYSAANAYRSAMFYILTYVLTTLGTFGVIMVLARQGFEADTVVDLSGLNQRYPLLAGIMAIFMFSLAGIPPMVGFYAKLAVLQALVATNDPFYMGLAIFAVVMSLIGAFYYLKVIKSMYFEAPVGELTPVRRIDARAVLLLNGAAVLGFGLFPDPLINWCTRAIIDTLAT